MTSAVEEGHFLNSALDMSPIEPDDSEYRRLMGNAPAFGDSRSTPLHLRFGPYEVNLHKRELRKGTLRLKVPHQSFQILAMLLERPGQVVSREDLRRELWPDDVFVNFEGSLNSAVQRLRSLLQDTSREPRYIETLPKEGYRFVARVEPLRPASREGSDGAATLGPGEFSVDRTPEKLQTIVSTPDRNSRHLALAAVSFFIIVVLGGYVGYRYSSRHKHVPNAQAQPAQPTLVVPSSYMRRAVAVMGFTNVSGNARDEWLSTAFSEMLATELAAGDHLRVVSEEDVSRAKHELSLTNRDSYGGNTLTKIRKDIGCDYVVAGSYLAIGQAGRGRVRLDARVEDALTGDTVASFAVVGSQSDLFNLASHAGEQLRAKLGAETLTLTEAEEVKLSLPSDPGAARLYSEGLAKLRLFDDVAAADLLESAIRLEPEYSSAYSALATAWSDLGYDTKATAAARKGMELAQNLPQHVRLQIEAHYDEINGDWIHAVEVYSRLRQLYPDNLDYGLNLAGAQDAMGKYAEATATLAVLRKLPFPEGDDPRIDLADARIAGELADYKREQTFADSAAGKAATTGARLLLARAKLTGGYASNVLGNLSGAIEAYSVARRIFAQSGDVERSALALMQIGGVLAKRGDVTGARHNIEQALNVFREHGDEAHQAAALSNLGEMCEIEGDLPKAEDLVREAAAILAKLNRVNQRDVVTYNLAELLQRQGKFRQAKDILEPLLEHVRGEGSKSVLGATLESLGSIAETQGDMATALSRYREAIAQFKETSGKTEYAEAERSLGRALLRGGDCVSAGQAFSEALSVDREIGATADAAWDQIELAGVALAQEGGSADVSTVRSAIDELRRRSMTDYEIEAEIMLAREMIQQGNTPLATKILGETAVLSAHSYDPTVRFDVALATARLRSSQHRFDEARRTVQPALQRAVAMGCVRCQLEARLELSEIEIQAGNAERGRAQLHQLADEAGNRGFRLIAEQATAGIGPAVPGNSSGQPPRRNPLP
ncbi:MAG: tetratricopeptide repeat protein [Candidatus Korobacteraceae bacterium]